MSAPVSRRLEHESFSLNVLSHLHQPRLVFLHRIAFRAVSTPDKQFHPIPRFPRTDDYKAFVQQVKLTLPTVQGHVDIFRNPPLLALVLDDPQSFANILPDVVNLRYRDESHEGISL